MAADQHGLNPPVILTIAGFDPSGGAGVLADLKAIHATGGYGCAVVTAQTVQDTRGVRRIWLEPCDGVAEQIETLLEDLPVAAVKIGMLGSDEMAGCVADALAGFGGPVVVDTVLKSSSGAALMRPGGAFARLLRRATLITPNLPEGEALLGYGLSADQMVRALSDGFNTAVLLKGGHGKQQTLTDYLARPSGELTTWRHPRIDTLNTHGTGCVLSSAIATALSYGKSLPKACEAGITQLQNWLRQSDWQLGHGRGPIRITP